MKVGVIVVRKQWNNAPIFLIEGIKQGIRELYLDKFDFKNIEFIFSRFTIHTPNKIYIDPESVNNFDILLIPFWMGEKILNCNLSELKEKNNNIKICIYTGRSIYYGFPFERNFLKKEVLQGSLTDSQWNNFLSIDRFFVIKKLYPFDKEIEIGCGQFDNFINTNEKSNNNGLIIDFCKQGWDEFIWEDFKEILPEIQRNCNVEIIQLGDYPFILNQCGIFSGFSVHYRKLCKLYNKAKIWISMNESFGYSILENKYAGNLILVHEKIDFPTFHFKSGELSLWNKDSIVDKIQDYLKKYNEQTPSLIRESFIKYNPELISWKETIIRLMNELQNI